LSICLSPSGTPFLLQAFLPQCGARSRFCAER
jgi:hypothetical protein